MSNEFKKVKGYVLNLPSDEEMKGYMFGIIGLLNLFNPLLINYLSEHGLNQKITDTRNMLYLVTLVLIDFWALYILTHKKRRRFLFVLFSPTVALVSSLFYLSFYYDIVYRLMKFSNPIYLVSAIVTFLVILIYQYYYIKSAIDKNVFYNLNKSSSIGFQSKNFIFTAVVIGITGGNLFFSKLDLDKKLLSMAYAVLIFGFILENMAHNFYKYYLLRKNEKEVL